VVVVSVIRLAALAVLVAVVLAGRSVVTAQRVQPILVLAVVVLVAGQEH